MRSIHYVRLLAVCTVILYSCTKNPEVVNTQLGLPTVISTEITAVTGSSAVSGGKISNEGASPVTARGIIWGNGTSIIATTVDGAGTGTYASNLTSLLPYTNYFVKAYATNANGTAYGNLISFKTGDIAPSPPTDDDALNLGNPTNALPYTSFPENYLKNNNFYKLAYSQSRGLPVWVAWHLQREDLGSTPRQDDFRADVNLPSGWYQVNNTSYSSSGFDKGHNCPSADRTLSIAANSSTFLMTNMIPQAPTLNQGPWAGLEDFIRNSLVGTNNEAYIFMGNFGVGGYNTSNTLVNYLDGGNIAIPAKIWKVIVILPKGNNDLSRLSNATTVLTVVMPNDNRLYTNGGTNLWRNYSTSVAALETEANASGVPLNLFDRVDASLRPVLKAKIY